MGHGRSPIRGVANRQHTGHEFLAPQPDVDDLRRLARPAFGAGLRPGFMAQLEGPVGHVVLLRPEKQVIGIDAGPHVAAMADIEALGDGTVLGKPRGPVGKLRRALPEDVAIAIGVAARRPEKAAGLRIEDAALGKTALQRSVRGTSLNGHRILTLVQEDLTYKQTGPQRTPLAVRR